jgi:hypothetical protein
MSQPYTLPQDQHMRLWERFYAKIERMTGQRREVRPRGRPRLDTHAPAPLARRRKVCIDPRSPDDIVVAVP